MLIRDYGGRLSTILTVAGILEQYWLVGTLFCELNRLGDKVSQNFT